MLSSLTARLYSSRVGIGSSCVAAENKESDGTCLILTSR